jgi:hypothetical protein
MMNCKDCQHELPDLLLNPRAPSAGISRHLDACIGCRAEYDSLRATFELLDEWQAPEPSAFFDQRLSAHLREEMAAPRLGFFSRLRDRILFSSSLQPRPALAGVMALVLVIGGGTFAGVYHSGSMPGVASSQPSATVNDLQILDKNEQAIQEMDQILTNDDSDASQDQPAI